MAQTTVVVSNPKIIPSQITLKGLGVDGVTTQFYMDDADGMASQISPFTGGTAFTSAGVVNLASIKEYLKSYALILSGFNFQAANAAQISNNLVLVRSTIDGTQAIQQIFSASSVSNLQNNPNLLNVNYPFIIDNATALKIVATDTSDYTITFKILAAVPHGQLDAFLAQAKFTAGDAGCTCS
jgi:ABC-type enterobactin transport system permease subunit